MPTFLTRRALLAWLALPAGCSLQPLAPLQRSPLSGQGLPAVRAPALGQRWTYKVFNAYNSALLDTIEETVSKLGPAITIERRSLKRGELPPEVQIAWGQVQHDPLWDGVQTYESPLPIWAEPLLVGAQHAFDSRYRANNASYHNQISVRSRVTALEQVTVGAGTFETARIERYIRLTHPDSSRQNYTRTDTLWFAPLIGRWVARETNGEYWVLGRKPSQWREDHLRWELQSWS